MEELLRIQSGNFTLEESMTLSQVEEAVANGTIGEKIVSIEDVLSMYPALICTPEGDRLLGNGNPVPEELVQGGDREEKVRMYKSSGNFTGIYGWDEKKTEICSRPHVLCINFLQKLAGADMEYLKIDGEFPRLSGSAVTLGKLTAYTVDTGNWWKEFWSKKEKGLQTVLFSLGIGSQMIFTKKNDAVILEDAGVDVLIECPLDARIRHMKADTFIKEILVGDLQAEHVAVGEDFRFGYERKGNPELLREMGKKLGFSVDVIPKRNGRKTKRSAVPLSVRN